MCYKILKEFKKILLFDGVCNLCNSTVQFIIKRDKSACIKFASLQSDIGKELLKLNNQSISDFNSIVYLRNNEVLIKSTAALYLLKDIGGFWRIMFLFIVIPKFIRDFFYSIISKNRYKWFGKLEVCLIPNNELKERFL